MGVHTANTSAMRRYPENTYELDEFGGLGPAMLRTWFWRKQDNFE